MHIEGESLGVSHTIMERKEGKFLNKFAIPILSIGSKFERERISNNFDSYRLFNSPCIHTLSVRIHP
jgi:hypothetical protein